MQKLVKVTAKFNHRLNDFQLDIVKSAWLLDKKDHYELQWITNPYGNLCIDLVWKKELNKIKQEHGTWDYVLIVSEKKYSAFKKKINQKIIDVAKTKSVDCFKNTFIDLSSFCYA